MCLYVLLATSQDGNEGWNASDDVAGIRCLSRAYARPLFGST